MLLFCLKWRNLLPLLENVISELSRPSYGKLSSVRLLKLSTSKFGVPKGGGLY
jgi:hypothetical protein